MKRICIVIFSIYTHLFNSQSNNLAPKVPFTDEYFEVKIVDEYRNLESFNDSITINWMKSQTEYTNSILQKIPNNDFYLKKRLEIDERKGYSISELKITNNNKYFYLKKKSDEETEKVYYKNGIDGKEEELYDPTNFISSLKDVYVEKNHNFIINHISPSWDGSKLAISISEKGKEISEIIIIDVEKRYIYPEIITNTNPSNIGGVKWLEDNTGFFYIYYPITDSNSKEYGKNTQTVLYRIGEHSNNFRTIFSSNNNPNLNIDNSLFPVILTFNSDDKYYIGILVNSEDFRDTFIIKKEDLLKGKKNWSTLYFKEDKVKDITLVNQELYFLSGFNSPNYKLCKTNLNNPNFRSPEIIIPEKMDEVITDYKITKDGIYFTRTKNGVEAKLYFINKKEKLIKIPFVSGNIDLQAKGKDYSDIWITCSGWANEEQRFKYNFHTNSFVNEDLVPRINYPEFKNVTVEEVTVKSYDGTEVPLSLIYNKKIKKNGKTPLLINGYGAFAESFHPYFSKSYLLWVNQGGMIAIPHVRGGGEKGEQWHIDGQKNKKSNSWKDLIACTEYLINKRYTSSDKIALLGGSAGGILMGRAMTERPELFKVVIIESGVMNPLRKEYSGGIGSSTIQEYGSVNDNEGFKALLEMDSYHHIKNNVKYPATLITGGINDSVVTPWMPTKFMAKLLESNVSENPILLKIDYEGGHGKSISVVQRYSNLSGIFAFAFWQLGHPDYQPKKE